jgi:hypothetical protein
LSYINGFINYNLATSQRVTTVNQPYSASAAAKSPDSYPQNSGHHGIALSGDGSKICNV